jgi:hypothetical protein
MQRGTDPQMEFLRESAAAVRALASIERRDPSRRAYESDKQGAALLGRTERQRGIPT